VKRTVRAAGAAALLIGVAFAVPARAQTGTAGTSGSSFADADFFIGIQKTEGINLSSFDLQKFFNKGACDCSVPVWVYATLTASGFAKKASATSGTIEILVGTNCNMPLYKAGCTNLYSDQITTFFAQGRHTSQTTARELSRNTTVTAQVDGGISTDTTADCSGNGIGTGFSQPIWLNLDFGSDGVIDFSTSTSVQIDLTPTPAPTNVKVAGGNEALNVSWTDIDFATNPDLQGYQILCRREADQQVFKDNTFGAYYKSARTYCPAAGMAAGIEGLDPLFACSPLLTRSTSSYRIKILENKVWYAAAVVAIDNSGNAAAPVLNGFDPTFMNPTNFAQPAPTLSFYQVYRNGNETNGAAGQMATPGTASGGFCAVAAPATRRPWTIVLAVGGALACAGLRRRRRK
jgi:hypothetical protein